MLEDLRFQKQQIQNENFTKRNLSGNLNLASATSLASIRNVNTHKHDKKPKQKNSETVLNFYNTVFSKSD